MKKAVVFLITLVAVVGLIAGTSFAVGSPGSSPKLVIANPVTELGDTVIILGSGFEAGQAVNLVFETGKDRIDISYALTGEASPVANDLGAFVTAWEPGRVASRIIASKRGGPGEGAYAITATDEDYNSLVSAPLAFWEADEELPVWAQ